MELNLRHEFKSDIFENISLKLIITVFPRLSRTSGLNEFGIFLRIFPDCPGLNSFKPDRPA